MFLRDFPSLPKRDDFPLEIALQLEPQIKLNSNLKKLSQSSYSSLVSTYTFRDWAREQEKKIMKIQFWDHVLFENPNFTLSKLTSFTQKNYPNAASKLNQNLKTIQISIIATGFLVTFNI